MNNFAFFPFSAFCVLANDSSTYESACLCVVFLFYTYPHNAVISCPPPPNLLYVHFRFVCRCSDVRIIPIHSNSSFGAAVIARLIQSTDVLMKFCCLKYFYTFISYVIHSRTTLTQASLLFKWSPLIRLHERRRRFVSFNIFPLEIDIALTLLPIGIIFLAQSPTSAQFFILVNILVEFLTPFHSITKSVCPQV